jgi:hypothetical protein
LIGLKRWGIIKWELMKTRVEERFPEHVEWFWGMQP